MTTPQGPAGPFPVSDLSNAAPTPFETQPDADARAELADALGLLALRKLRFSGTIAAEGKRDWRLDGKLGATVVQPCVVTLDPVTTRIDVPVTRRFLAEMPQGAEGDEGEIEMAEDDSIEPLPRVIDVSAVMAEALALHLPLYPRASGADLGEAVFTEPGLAPMRDEDAKPFAGLAGLRDTLTGRSDDAGDGEDQ